MQTFLSLFTFSIQMLRSQHFCTFSIQMLRSQHFCTFPIQMLRSQHFCMFSIQMLRSQHFFTFSIQITCFYERKLNLLLLLWLLWNEVFFFFLGVIKVRLDKSRGRRLSSSSDFHHRCNLHIYKWNVKTYEQVAYNVHVLEANTVKTYERVAYNVHVLEANTVKTYEQVAYNVHILEANTVNPYTYFWRKKKGYLIFSPFHFYYFLLPAVYFSICFIIIPQRKWKEPANPFQMETKFNINITNRMGPMRKPYFAARDIWPNIFSEAYDTWTEMLFFCQSFFFGTAFVCIPCIDIFISNYLSKFSMFLSYLYTQVCYIEATIELLSTFNSSSNHHRIFTITFQ